MTKQKRNAYFFRLKNQVMEQGAIAISDFKMNNSHGAFENVITQLYKLPQLRKYLYESPFTKNASKFGRNVRFANSESLLDEFLWHASIISIFSEEITDFMSYRTEFSNALLLGKYDTAEQILNNVEAKYGLSLWLYENWIILLEQRDGSEKQLEYSNKIITDSTIDRDVRLHIVFFSNRMDKNYSSNLYRNHLRDLIKSVHKDHIDVMQHIHFKLDMFYKKQGYDYKNLLSFESYFSVIDRYLQLIKVAQFIICFEKDEDILTAALEAINVLSRSKIADEIIQNITSVAVDSCDVSILSERLKILDNYTIGNYCDSIQLCNNFLNKRADSMDVLIIQAKSMLKIDREVDEAESGNLLQSLLLSCINLISKNEKAFESYMYIQKLIDIYTSHSWAQQLHILIYQEYYYNPFDNKATEFIKYGLLNSIPYNPLQILYSPSSEIYDYLIRISYLSDSSATVNLHQAIRGRHIDVLLTLPIPTDRKDRFVSKILLEKGQYDQSYELIKKYISSDDVIIRQDFLTVLSLLYIKKGDYREAVSIMVDSIFENNNMYVKLPIKEFLDKIEMERNSDLYGSLDKAILYEMYSRFIDSDKDYYIYDSYEDFLEYHGYQRPSELEKIVQNFDRKKLVYFLEKVCVQQIMDSSTSFEDTEDIEKERISVCQVLKRINAENSNKYSEEIKKITHRLMVKRAVLEVEESKIYVDVDGIKKIVGKTSNEKFSKFYSMSGNEIEVGYPLDDYKAMDSIQIAEQETPIYRATNAKKKLFIEILIEIRNIFVYSDEFGLDGYLSNGIRHGTIQGQLRMPLEKVKLITKKDGESNVYKENEYWKKKLSSYSDRLIQKSMKLLSDFSRSIDELNDKIKNELIQIKTENKNPLGMFDFNLYLHEVEGLYDVVTVEKLQYEDFVDVIVMYLWEKTESSLSDIRGWIKYDLINTYRKMIFELQREFELLSNSALLDYGDNLGMKDLIATIIDTKTSMEYELDKIANWFKKRKDSAYADYQVNLPIEIAAKMIQNIYPNHMFDPTITHNTTHMLKGKTLKHFVDIYFILFDNIIKHAYNGEFCPEVSVVVTSMNNELQLKVTNTLSMRNDDTIKKKVDDAKSNLLKSGTFEKVSKEGGSGFYKIKKIISVDLGYDFNFDIQYTTDIIDVIIILQGGSR